MSCPHNEHLYTQSDPPLKDFAHQVVPDDNKFCRNNFPCVMKHNRSISKVRQGQNSLTHLGNLGGYLADSPSQGNAYMNNVYGASFQTVHREPNYYTYTETKTVLAPWEPEALRMEATYMNHVGQMNKGGYPKTYKELELSPVPLQTHEAYESPIHKQVPDSQAIMNYPDHQAIEHFGWDGPGYEYKGLSRYIWKFFLVFIVFLVVYWFMKNYDKSIFL